MLAILGTGTQAGSHAQALGHIRDFTETRVWGCTPDKAKAFIKEHGCIAMDAEDAVRAADIVVTAISSQTPVLQGAYFKKGTRVNAVRVPIAT